MDNVVAEPELYSLGLPGISFHTVRLSTKERRWMPEQAITLAPIFVESGVDLIVYACAETSFLGGPNDHGRVSDEITAATGIPSTTAVSAMVEALRALKSRRIALVTPYSTVRTELMKESLLEHGFETVHSVNRDFNAEHGDAREWFYTNRQPPHVAYQMAREADRPEADTVLVSATNFRTLDVIDLLEETLGKPVITTNQAILWASLRRLRLWAPISGRGRLLRQIRPETDPPETDANEGRNHACDYPIKWPSSPVPAGASDER